MTELSGGQRMKEKANAWGNSQDRIQDLFLSESNS